MKMKGLLAGIALCCAIAQAASSAMVAGSPALNFSLQDVHGHTVKLDQYYGKIIVLEWRDPRCQYVQKYYQANTMQALQKKYTEQNGVIWLTILVGAHSDKAALHSTNELLDPAREVTELYGITRVPEVVIINPAGFIVYKGAVDSIRSNSPEDVARARVNYIANSLDALLTNNPVSVSHTRPFGCDAMAFKPAGFHKV
jgi:peroxiredoxin